MDKEQIKSPIFSLYASRWIIWLGDLWVLSGQGVKINILCRESMNAEKAWVSGTENSWEVAEKDYPVVRPY